MTPRLGAMIDPNATAATALSSDPSHELPPPETRRWVVRHKAMVVRAVRDGRLSLQEACQRYNLSVEEFLGWQRSIERYGVPGLRVTRLQIYRDTDEMRAARR